MENIADVSSDNEQTQGAAEWLTFEVAQEWVIMDHNDDLECPDILSIVKNLLQDAGKHQTIQSTKALLPLTAVTHFVKLRAAYATNPKC